MKIECQDMKTLPPNEVIISITNRCNLRCRMCAIPIRKAEELSFPKWKSIIRDIAAAGAQTVVFSGGEPLLRSDIFELISFAKGNNMSACITSNGFMLNGKIAARLSKAEVDVVNVSIEGPKDIHDFLRGTGTFDKAIYALENLKKYKIESTIAAVVCRYNFRHLRYIAELAKGHGVTTVKFQPFSRIFLSEKHNVDDFLIPREDIDEARKVMREVAAFCKDYNIAANPASYLGKIPAYLNKERSVNIDYPGFNRTCPALRVSSPINSQGQVFPCWVLAGEDKIVGDLRESSFLDIWGSEMHNSLIEEINARGCPGCMMSCYDKNFGEDKVKERVLSNMKRLKNGGLPEYTVGLIKRLNKSLRFYPSYRGSLKQILMRSKSVFKKEMLSKKRKVKRDNIKKTLNEIGIAKDMIERAKDF